MTAKFELYVDQGGHARFRLKAGNGETILAASQGYSSREAARKGIASVQTNAPVDAHYSRKEDAGGKPYFVLKAGNGEIIGKSQPYSTTGAMEHGIDSVKSNAPDAKIEDHC